MSVFALKGPQTSIRSEGGETWQSEKFALN